MRAGKIVALIAGILILLIGLALLVPGAVLWGIYGTQRDDDGFFTTSGRTLSSNGSALVTPDIDLDLGPVGGNWMPIGDSAAIRLEATSSGDEPLFIGIGSSAEVARYLDGVDYDEVTDFGWGMHSVRYRHIDGATPATPPGEQDFWAGSEEGSGTVTLDWDVEDGNWTAVVMNVDGSAPVRAEVSVGGRFDILLPIAIGLTVAGVVLLGLGILLIVLGARRPKTPPYVPGQMPYAPGAPYPPGTPYPPAGQYPQAPTGVTPTAAPSAAAPPAGTDQPVPPAQGGGAG